MIPDNPQERSPRESGNILFMILIAIVLIGALTAAIQFTSRPEGANIDNETLVIRVSEAQRYASELERAVLFIVQSGKSESDIRFAHPDAPSAYGDLGADADPTDQVFHKQGGGAAYRDPPEDINDGSPWEFYGGTHMPGVGSSRAELIAVLPNVTDAFCARVNEINGQPTATPPSDDGGASASGASPGDCLNIGPDGRFNDTQQFYTSVNDTDETTFAQETVTNRPKTALQACVVCNLDGANHFYHVLMAR